MFVVAKMTGLEKPVAAEFEEFPLDSDCTPGANVSQQVPDYLEEWSAVQSNTSSAGGKVREGRTRLSLSFSFEGNQTNFVIFLAWIVLLLLLFCGWMFTVPLVCLSWKLLKMAQWERGWPKSRTLGPPDVFRCRKILNALPFPRCGVRFNSILAYWNDPISTKLKLKKKQSL